MVEKQIEFTIFKTSTIELDCGWSRKLKFTTERSSIMNYRNKKTGRKPNPKTAPALRELTVATMVDIFYLKEEVDKCYAEHVPCLDVVFTTYRHPENGMLISEDLMPYIAHLIQTRGYDLIKEETLIGYASSRRILRLTFAAQIGLFPNWPRPAKGED